MDMAPPVNAVQAAWLALRDAVNEEWAEREASASSRNLRAMAIAKKLYEAGHYLNAPNDNPVMGMSVPMMDGKGIAIVGPFCPAWATYLGEAQSMLDVVESAS